MTSLLYVVFMLPGLGWHGSVELLSTKDLARCDAVVKQLRAANSHSTYVCETLVQPSLSNH